MRRSENNYRCNYRSEFAALYGLQILAEKERFDSKLDFAIILSVIFGWISGTIYEGTSNIQLSTIAKLIDQEHKYS